MVMMWILWASMAFAGAMLVYWVTMRVRRRRKFEANRAEIERIAGFYGIPEDAAFHLVGRPPEEIARLAHEISHSYR